MWVLGVISWFVIRYPHSRRSRRTLKIRRIDRGPETILLIFSGLGLGIIPASYVFANMWRFADYTFQPWQAWAGLGIFSASLWLFRLTHRELGRNWSVTLELRDQHVLVTKGVYGRVRHPMYAAFWLWALAQAFLLQNWVAGPVGLIGFGTLFFFRVRREEQLMIETFGKEYRDYMTKTYRIIPGLY